MEQLGSRQLVLQVIFGCILAVFVGRLFFIQVISDDYRFSASQNATKRVVLEPTRGIIYDRTGRIYVTNTPIYDLTIIPRELDIPDTTVLEKYLGLKREEIRERIKAAWDYSPHKTSILEKQIDAEVFAPLQEHLWQMKGIYAHVRNTRTYRYPVGANFLGYISEVDKKDIEKSASYYQQGDLIGRTGIERQYEDLLRGRKGVKMVMVDVRGREVGAFQGGQYDTIPDKGEDIVISIDAELQAFGERLMGNKIGSIVAIEPATGEILAFVSAPTYDPNLLAGMMASENFKALKADSLLPLFNRPLMARYPPGSTFKILNGLTAMAVGSLGEQSFYGCAAGFLRNGGRPGCHFHPTPLNLFGAIQHSCNAFFAGAYVDMLQSRRFENFEVAYDTWYEYMSRFGVGHRLGIDIPNESPGRLPNKAFYNKWYGKDHWKAMTIVSNSIGQGELEMTPLQMANCAAIMANRGYYVQPHFLRNLQGKPGKEVVHFDNIKIDMQPALFNLVADAMEQVVLAGTGTMAQVDSITVCGKTGTAENSHGEDHSVFFAFAPKENPKIAIAIIVENSGFGGTWAAPIASLMIEKYLKGSISPKQQPKLDYILAANFLKSRGKHRPKTPYIRTATPAAPGEPVPATPVLQPVSAPVGTLPTKGLGEAPE